MGLITPNDYDSLRALYTGQLQYLLSTENQIVEGLDSMIKHAQDQQLINAFQQHQEETKVQATRLQGLIQELTGDEDDKKDPVCVALIGSGVNITRESSEGPVRDAGLLATAQKIEHYEIASYGSARDWAEVLGLSNHVTVLETTLQEEKKTDQLLTQISKQANPEAAYASA